jgi:hypothetical protein
VADAAAARGQPLGALGGRAQLRLPRGDAILDALVVDAADRRRIVGDGVPDDDAACVHGASFGASTVPPPP